MPVESPSSESASDLLAREAGHRIKNDLHLLVAWIAQAARLRRSDESILQETISRILVIASLHDQLSEHTGGLCHMPERLNALALGLSQVAGCADRDIQLDVLCESIWLPPEQARLALILAHELVVNAVRHAFGAAGGRVTLSLRRRGYTNILSVADNGSGLASTLSRSGGEDIVAALVRRLDGTIQRRGAQPSGLVVEIAWASEDAADFETDKPAGSSVNSIVRPVRWRVGSPREEHPRWMAVS
jgi:two-component sensor histidine kinase